MAKPLNPEQRDRIAEKVMDFGNLAFVAMVISQFVSDGFNLPRFILGGLLAAEAYYVGYLIMKGGGGL